MTDLAADQLPADPLALAKQWFDAACSARAVPNPNAMTLVTVEPDNKPSARIVLCKQFAPTPGYVVFYTNYESRKGREIAATGNAAAVFHFDHAGRQIRLEGRIVRSPAAESDDYFRSRPWQSQVGAWASEQSQPIDNRAQLAAAAQRQAAEFGLPDPLSTPLASAEKTLPRPPFWGGYRLWAERVELWCDGHARLHDRGLWQRQLTPAEDGNFLPGAWSATRLSP